jgi:hypothetical protein
MLRCMSSLANFSQRDTSLVQSFFTQLERVPNLKPLISIPLLCTLTTSVFSGMTSLPEGKAELYRIFVDLLCSGWDVAKGVHRESRFNAATKLRLLIRLAATLQNRKQRTIKSGAIRELIKDEGFVHLSLWEALVGDGAGRSPYERWTIIFVLAPFISGILMRTRPRRPECRYRSSRAYPECLLGR